MPRDLLHVAGRALIGLYTRTMLDVDVRYTAGYERGPKIVAVNHPTTTDPFVVFAAFPERMSVLILASLFTLPLFGEYLRATGHIPVAVEDGRAAFAEAVRRVERGEVVGIFPEGVLSPEDGLGQFRNGAARLSLATGVPVVPVGVAVQRGRATVVETEIAGVPHVARWYLRGPYAITVGAPVLYSGDVADRARVLAVTEGIARRIGGLARESDRRVEALAAAGGSRALSARLGRMVGAARRAVSPTR